MDEQIHRTVVLLLDSRNTGGIESHVLLLARSLKSKGMHPLILFMKHYGEAHPLEDAIQTSGLEYDYLNGGISKLCSKLNSASLLHTHGYKAGISGRLAGKLTGTPVISTFHNGDLGHGRMRIYTMLDRIMSLFSLNIAVSQEIAKKLPFNKLVIPNFVDMPNPAIRSTGKTIGFVGRLSHEKGPDVFIKLAQSTPEQSFRIYGDGPLKSELEANTTENITFMGMTRNMADHWPDIGLLCITSRDEGLPLVALEAMSYGIPVLASRVGGLPQLIQQDVNGWLATTEDLNTFSKYIQQWQTADSETQGKIAENCINTVAEHYSCDALVPQILNIYRQALH